MGSGRVAGGVAVGTELGRPTVCGLGLRLLLSPPPKRPQALTSKARTEATITAEASFRGPPAAGKTRILLSMVAFRTVNHQMRRVPGRFCSAGHEPKNR